MDTDQPFNQNDLITLLYVDDEPDLLMIGKIFLERTGGFQVDTMTSAEEAIKIQLNQTYDAIVSDYQMPGMDGIEFLKVVRNSYGDVPFILFTGRGREEVVIEAINNGADFYLQKGGETKSQFAELSHKIKQAVRRRRAENDRQKQFEELIETKEALQESESKFRAIVETTPDVIWEIDLDGIFTYISPRSEDIIGYTPDEVIGKSYNSILHPDGQKSLKKLFDNINNRNPGLTSFDIPAIHKNGHIVILNCRSHPLIHSNGAIIGFRGITTDVTKKTEFVNALHESELRLRSFFEATNEAVFLIDEDGRIIEWNSSAERISGIRKDEALGMYLWNLMYRLVPPEHRNEISQTQIVQSIQTSLKTGIPVFREPRIFEAIRPDGKRIFTRQTVFPIKTEIGYRFGSISQDITEERYMAEALRESEERFRGMAERSPDLIIILDKEMNISYVSPSVRNILGYKPDELIKHPVDSACAPIFSRSSLNLQEIISKVKRGEAIENEELLLQKYDGTGVFVNFYAIPVMNAEILSGVQISMRDITQKKNTEQILRESEEKFVTLFKKNPVPLTLVSAADGSFVDVNDNFVLNTGFSRDDIIGKKAHDIGIFLNDSEYLKFSKEIRENHAVNGLELQCRTKSGDIRVCRFTSSIVIIRGVPQILSSIEDITQYKQNENTVREREERYRLIMQNAYEGILVNDLTPNGPGTFVDANESACNILGMPREELQSKKLIDLDTPDMKVRAPAIMKEILKNGHASFQTNYISPDNQEKFIDISVSLFTLNKKPTMLSIIRDITNQKAAESALNAMVTSMVGISGKDSLDRITDSISEWLFADCVMIGEISPDKEYVQALSMVFDGKRVAEFSFPIKGTPCEKTLKHGFTFFPDSLSTIYPETKKITGRDFQGYIGSQLKNSNGEITGLMCIVSNNPINPGISVKEIIDIIAGKAGADIELAHIEQVLLENQRMLAETMDMANLVSWEYIFSSQTFVFNDRFYAMYGTTAEREGGYHMDAETYIREFVYPADIPKVIEEASKSSNAIDPNFISVFEHRFIRRDGEIRHVSVQVRAIFDEHGTLIKTHGANQDITERKLIEEAILKANRQLNLLSSITRHDILNNISVFYGYLELLEMESENSGTSVYIQKMSEGIQKIQSQIEFSRIYQDLGSQKPMWISLDTILSNLSPPDTIHFTANVSGIFIFADPMLERVFYNLLDNSIRHGDNLTTVFVSAYESERSLMIVFEDDGVGVPIIDKNQIFERGFGKNTGHGLFLVREILSLTGITIQESGVPGKGARFEIIVPSGSYRINR
ncbi:PAS domain S-box protein [Methanospirillum purgamenti]|uniref:histidine kinase n=1 Tax=Methanospirillum hungatei TaxID=2203 RepID=A0A8F5ZEN5_METHU|nr:PAS domain S-box protein [Methanospirillum hungatei]QXO94600.1 PAS domain S-box protein [Methanospirillum hungatei]